MGWISSQFARNWRNIQYGIIVVLSVCLIIWPGQANKIVVPVVINGLYYPFFKIKTAVETLSAQAEDIEGLRKKLTETAVQVELYEEAIRENARLRNVLGFEPPSGYRLMPAEIVSLSGHRLPVTAIIDRGARDSVFVNQPVINQDGLIGRVINVTDRFATVQLLTHPANRVAVRVEKSREMGIVRYLAGEGMIMDNFPIHGTIAVGDTIISSELGGVYPPGLGVATVTDVQRNEHEAFAKVRLQPVVNFHSIEELFLLRVADLK